MAVILLKKRAIYQNMRVLHYIRSFASTTFIYDYILELERQGIDNYVVTHQRINELERPFSKVVVAKSPTKWNVEFLTRRLIYKSFGIKKPSWAQKKRALKKVILDVNPDVIHAHFGPQGAIIREVAKGLKIPVFVHFHGYDAFSLPKNPFWFNQYKKMDKDFAAIICISEYMQNEMANIFQKSNLKIIHVGKKLSDYSFKEPNNHIKKWISIGRLSDKKGHEDTIKAFSKILNNYPNQQLKIIGGWNKEKAQYLHKLVNRIGHTNNINLSGAKPHKEVMAELVNADAFILSSKTSKSGDKEGIPTVLMEAQATGLPCVSTKHSGIPEVFPEENKRFLGKEGNITSIANKIEHLIKSDIKEIKQVALRGRKKVERDFNITYEVEKLIKLYEAF